MTALDATARTLQAEAWEHKRLSGHHRRKAREKMQELAAYCASHGIELIQEESTHGG